MAINPQLLTDLMKQAMNQPMGLVLETSNPATLQVYLANHRREWALTEFDELIFVVPSTPDTLMIVKKSVELQDVRIPSNEHQSLPD